MARIRSIKPEFWTSEQVMECSLSARLLFIGLWNFADDLGRMSMSAKSIKAQIFPSDEITSETILGMIQDLSNNGLLLLYTVEGKDYLQITGWQHQRIDKPQPGKHPAPVNGYSKNVRGMVATDTIGEEGKGEDRNSEAIASGAEAPPDPRKRLFDEGLPKLAAMTGKGPDACRSFVGKCLKAASDDAITVLGLIEDAERNRVADPSAWIAARLKSTGPPAKPLTEHQRKQHQTKEILDELANFAAGRGGSGDPNPGLLRYDPGGGPEGVRGGAGGDVDDLPSRSH
jgi:hypothetical protein